MDPPEKLDEVRPRVGWIEEVIQTLTYGRDCHAARKLRRQERLDPELAPGTCLRARATMPSEMSIPSVRYPPPSDTAGENSAAAAQVDHQPVA